MLWTMLKSKAKTAGKKLGILNKVKRYFTPEQLSVPSSSSVVHGVLQPFMGWLCQIPARCFGFGGSSC
ncbi:jg5564 [Pararge aegeria aegeria]|uniref:Jg5564 protein n=1 Tax=Pararge aegeria aegeria TaxID=348720 RepID=A0A8S4RMR5_9NEOP|nr:jg5564 [Pararge aegeria aegeria]